jgi:hypothetical protein
VGDRNQQQHEAHQLERATDGAVRPELIAGAADELPGEDRLG